MNNSLISLKKCIRRIDKEIQIRPTDFIGKSNEQIAEIAYQNCILFEQPVGIDNISLEIKFECFLEFSLCVMVYCFKASSNSQSWFRFPFHFDHRDDTGKIINHRLIFIESYLMKEYLIENELMIDRLGFVITDYNKTISFDVTASIFK